MRQELTQNEFPLAENDSYKVLINCSQVVTGGSGNKFLQTT